MNHKETTSETRFNTSSHLKEFWYLNQLEWKLPFDLCENNVFCKKNFFSTLARYIETLKKEKTDTWENEIQNFIDSVVNGSFGKWLNLLKNVNTFLCKKQLERFNKNWYQDSARLMENILEMKHLFEEEENWITSSSIVWIRTDLIPNWYYEWTANSWLYNEIREKNVKDLANVLSEK